MKSLLLFSSITLAFLSLFTGINAPAEERIASPSLIAPDARVSHGLSLVDDQYLLNTLRTLQEGEKTFRFDTFGDQAFWGDTLRLHEAIAGAALGGVGPGVSPNTALDVGLKVDLDALPWRLRNALRHGRVDLDDPAVTLELLRLNAVVGVRGFFDASPGRLSSVGITCALCHAIVDDAFAPGIGRRLDGWANRDLDVGAITALAPNLQPFVTLLNIVDPAIDENTVRAVLRSWGPASSTPNCCWTARRSALTANPPLPSSRRRSA